MNSKRKFRVMIVSTPSSPLGTIPQKNGYDVRCSQVFLALALSDSVEKIFTLEFVSNLDISDFSYSSDKYVPCLFQFPNIALRYNSRILIYSSFVIKTLEVITSKKFWSYFKASDLLFIECVYLLFPLYFLLGIFSRILNKIYVLEMHDVLSFGKKINLLLKGVSLLVEKILTSLSSWIVCFTYEEGKYLKNKNISVIPTSTLLYNLNQNVFGVRSTKTNLQRLLHDYSHYKLVTFVGDLRTPANRPAVDDIVKTLAPNFLDSRKDIVFVIAGDGYELWKKVNIPKNVLFTGHLDKDELYYLLTKSAVCIAPLTYNTGFKSKIVSYITAKKPVILTKEAALSLPLQRLPSLIVVPLEDFANKIIEVVDHEEIFSKKAEFSYQYFEKYFSFDKFKQSYNNLISFLAAKYKYTK